MKKIYVTPQTEAMEMDMEELLTVSGTLDGEAVGPALSRDDIIEEDVLQ